MGSNLLSLAGAVWVAKQLARTVIVDWRDTVFLKDPTRNYFTEFFAQPSEIQGVPVLYAPVEGLEHTTAPENERSQVEPQQIPPALRDATTFPPFIILKTFHAYERVDPAASPAEQHWRLKDFYRSIRPAPGIAERLERFWNENLRDRFVVGLNVSTGNGEYAKGEQYAGRVDTAIFDREGTFLKRLDRTFSRRLRGLPRYLRDEAKLFFATDSAEMRETLLRLPYAATRRECFPPPGAGRHYNDYEEQGYDHVSAAADVVIDMLLLARCNALIRNGSGFNIYAVTVTDWFDGNVVNFETLYSRYWLRTARLKAKRTLRR